MGQPITFRNVDAPDLRDSGALLRGAQDSFNASGNIFSKLVQDRQGLRKDSASREREAMVTGFRDYMGTLKTPEALAAAEADGSFAQQLNRLDPASREKLRGDVGALMGNLRADATQEHEYGRMTGDRDARPFMERIQARAQAAAAGQSEEEVRNAIGALDAEIDAGISGGEIEERHALELRATLADQLRSGKTSVRDDVRYGQGQEAYNRQQDELLRSDRDRAQADNMGRAMTELMGGARSEREFLGNVSERLSAEGVTGTDAQQFLAQARDIWVTQNAPTAAEANDAALHDALATRQAAYLKSRNPENQVFSFPDSETVTDGGAIQQLQDMTPKDRQKTIKNVRSATEEFKEELGGRVARNVPWGAIMLEAGKREGPSSWMLFDFEDISKSGYKKQLRIVYDEWRMNDGNALKNKEIDEDVIRSRFSRALPKPTQP